jgi:hypothetical protein
MAGGYALENSHARNAPRGIKPMPMLRQVSACLEISGPFSEKPMQMNTRPINVMMMKVPMHTEASSEYPGLPPLHAEQEHLLGSQGFS